MQDGWQFDLNSSNDFSNVCFYVEIVGVIMGVSDKARAWNFRDIPGEGMCNFQEGCPYYLVLFH